MQAVYIFNGLLEGTFCKKGIVKLEVKWSAVKGAQSCPTLCEPMSYTRPWNSPGQNTGVGSLSLLQCIFPTQGLNPGPPHCRQILYQLSHKGSPRILVWVAYPFSRGYSWFRNWTGVFCIAGGFFTNWAIGEALINLTKSFKEVRDKLVLELRVVQDTLTTDHFSLSFQI